MVGGTFHLSVYCRPRGMGVVRFMRQLQLPMYRRIPISIWWWMQHATIMLTTVLLRVLIVYASKKVDDNGSYY